jgi:hypothetical protein
LCDNVDDVVAPPVPSVELGECSSAALRVLSLTRRVGRLVGQPSASTPRETSILLIRVERPSTLAEFVVLAKTLACFDIYRPTATSTHTTRTRIDLDYLELLGRAFQLECSAFRQLFGRCGAAGERAEKQPDCRQLPWVSHPHSTQTLPDYLFRVNGIECLRGQACS